VLRGWAEFNSDDPPKVEKTFAVTENALRAAQAYGADTVLLVPCRIGGMKMPSPRQFAIEFDPQDRPPHPRPRRRCRRHRLPGRGQSNVTSRPFLIGAWPT
jgi:hypothetical protein